MTSEDLARLEWLQAREAIHDLNMRYCRATDRGDIALWRSAFHPDGTGDYGFFRGNGWDFGDQALPLLRKKYAATHHVLGNEFYVIEGERAEGEISIFSLKSSSSEPGRAEFLTGRYLDRYERRSGVWGIVHRHYIPDGWDAQCFGGDCQNGCGEAKLTFSSNDRSDPSYRYELIGSSSL